MLSIKEKTQFKLNTQHRSLLADTVTPVSLYLKLRDQFPNSFLLESSDYHSRENHYSFLCCDPVASFKAEGNTISTSFPDGSSEKINLSQPQQLASLLSEFSGRFEAPKSKFDFATNGLFGYLSYDAIQYFETLQLTAPQNPDKAIPEIQYHVFRFVIVFDHHKHQVHLFDHFPAQKDSQHSLDTLETLFFNRNITAYRFHKTGPEGSNLKDEDFKALVSKGKQHCQRGDVFQMVLSRSFSQPFRGDDFNVYRALRALNPSPYLFYFDYGNFRLFGSSPEAQLTIRDGLAGIHPIAGTYRRTGNKAEDQALAKALQEDPKENAEHVMLVDLARNDLSRHANEVTVETFSEVQYFSHVIHLVSKVTGKVMDGSSLKIVGDTFPAGTLSGAPKYRAMQLIDQYEPERRNFYGGAIGFMGFDGSFNHAIIIRSCLSKNQKLSFQAGAGVVVKSDEEKELQEVNNKVAAIRAALNKAEEI